MTTENLVKHPLASPRSCLSRALLSFVSSSMVLSGIVDDAQPGFIIYSGTQWTHSNRNSNYNRTITECQVGTQNPNIGARALPPSFNLTFYGTTVNIYGGPITANTAFNYSFDGGTLTPASINSNAVGKFGANIWSFVDLSAGQHTLQVVPVAGLFSLDYITFTPTTLTTSVTRNLNLVWDDSDSAVQFTGNWTKSTSVIPGDVPYEGTRTGSSTEGDTMKVTFVGSSIFVDGLLNQVPGKLSASFSVDGAKATTFSPFDGSQDANASFWALSQQFFHQNLTPGQHSLVVTVQQATGSQSLWIDSVVFGATSNTTITPASQSSSKKAPGKTTIGVIAGAVSIVILMWLLSRCRGKKKKRTPTETSVVEYRPTIHIPQEEPAPTASQSHHYFPVQIQNLVISNDYGTPTMPQGPNMPMEHYTGSHSVLLPQQYNNRQNFGQATLPPAGVYVPPRSDLPPQQHGSYMSMHPRAPTSPGNLDASNAPPPQQDGSYMSIHSRAPILPGNESGRIAAPPQQDGSCTPEHWSTQGSSAPAPTSQPHAQTQYRGPSPSQQDGSDGPQHYGSSSVIHEPEVEGSESFTQLKLNTTLLTYNSTPQARPSNNVSGSGIRSTSRTTEQIQQNDGDDDNDEPPPYNPYE